MRVCWGSARARTCDKKLQDRVRGPNSQANTAWAWNFPWAKMDTVKTLVKYFRMRFPKICRCLCLVNVKEKRKRRTRTRTHAGWRTQGRRKDASSMKMTPHAAKPWDITMLWCYTTWNDISRSFKYGVIVFLPFEIIWTNVNKQDSWVFCVVQCWSHVNIMTLSICCINWNISI